MKVDPNSFALANSAIGWYLRLIRLGPTELGKDGESKMENREGAGRGAFF